MEFLTLVTFFSCLWSIFTNRLNQQEFSVHRFRKNFGEFKMSWKDWVSTNSKEALQKQVRQLIVFYSAVIDHNIISKMEWHTELGYFWYFNGFCCQKTGTLLFSIELVHKFNKVKSKSYANFIHSKINHSFICIIIISTHTGFWF